MGAWCPAGVVPVNPAPAPGVCAVDGCSNTFELNRRGRPRLYCEDCSQPVEYNRRWRRGETHAGPPKPRYVKVLPRPAVCKGCGRDYMQTAPAQRYCSRECCPPTGAKVTVLCDVCAREFEARARDRERGWGRYCSKSCSMRAKRAAWRKAVAA
jgi:hypothetical protein